ncbi:MAG: hypothetical protein IKW64_01075 [Clostridia bacterium]|nr:hypothetical protein [Clostridia bacterium]
MTKKELMQVYYLNKEIINETEELVELKIKARRRAGETRNPKLESLIALREKEIVEKVRRCTALRDKINEFINSIDDSLTRQIIYYRYAKCMTWRQVAYMTGGYNTEEGVRKISERYLKKVTSVD